MKDLISLNAFVESSRPLLEHIAFWYIVCGYQSIFTDLIFD